MEVFVAEDVYLGRFHGKIYKPGTSTFCTLPDYVGGLRFPGFFMKKFMLTSTSAVMHCVLSWENLMIKRDFAWCS